MSSKTSSEDQWELSKENIQPLQQGRRPEVLKQALREHPEDPIQLQRQAFENELRTYSGQDPLSVWCKYINWVEQNFLKGGKDGHIGELIQKCLSILKEETKYYDDKRFIALWLKFANASVKPVEVYNYMYTHNIGCYSADFFIAWSWELEQQHNIKKASQVLLEGINRNADPVDKIKSAFSEFEMRVTKKVMENKQSADPEVQRSAFAMLKPHKKSAPVMRVGDSVIEPNRAAMVINRQQPAPKCSIPSTKVPFKIYKANVNAPALPLQSAENLPFVVHSDQSKENELKPSKWNKVKVKQMPSHTRSNTEIGFKFHCDEAPQPTSTPRSVPKVSDVLRVRQYCNSPRMALFEPPDPMKCPMYDKNKVYGGAEEFSFEELRAAAWLEKHKLGSNQDSKDRKTSNALPLCNGNKKPLVALMSPPNPMKRPIYDRDKIYNSKEELSFEEIRAFAWVEKQRKLESEQKLENSPTEIEFLQKQINCLTEKLKTLKESTLDQSNLKKTKNENDFITHQLDSGHNQKNKNMCNNLIKEENAVLCSRKSVNHSDNNTINNQEQKENTITMPEFGNMPTETFTSIPSVTDILRGKCPPSTSYCEAADMLQELYNHTTPNLENQIIPNFKDNNCESETAFPFYPSEELEIPRDIFQNFNKDNILPTSIGISDLSFKLYQDPTENISKENKKITNSVTSTKANLPFSLYQDPEENVLQPNCNSVNPVSVLKTNVPSNLYEDATKCISEQNNIPSTTSSKENALAIDQYPNEDIENIPPKGFVQSATKREPSGILTLAKDILFIPLEQQQLDDTDSEEEIITDESHAKLRDETLIPPCNTEQFVSAPFYSSTPCTSAKNAKKANSQMSNEIDSCPYGPTIHFENIDTNHNMQVVDNISDKPTHKIEKSNHTVKPISSLSVILETSKESYKSSSSSSSSVSATKLSNFNQGYSYEKNSNITNHKEFSDGIMFKEPKPVNCPTDISSVSHTQLKSFQFLNKKPAALFISNIDPFSDQLNEELLKSLDQPPEHYDRLEISENNFKGLKVTDQIEIKKTSYLIESLVAEGAYGKVYLGKTQSKHDLDKADHNSKFAIKVCKHANEWELYISFSLQKRLKLINKIPTVQLSVMNIIASKKCGDNMILVSEYTQQGTLLDLVNYYRKQNLTTPEYLAMYLTLELIQIMSQIHKCKIIHADVKPDNILVRNDILNVDVLEFLDSKTSLLKFIDFGRSIDLNFFEEGVCFKTPLKSRCIEVLEDKPWVFQPDWLGILDCIHSLLFLEYAKVKKSADGRWEIVKKLRRYWATDIWSSLFDELLNIPACYEEPNICDHVVRIKAKLQQNAQCLKNSITHLKKFYLKK